MLKTKLTVTVLLECGFIQGNYNKNQECIKPADRREIIERILLGHGE